jgi:hypothetical protein
MSELVAELNQLSLPAAIVLVVLVWAFVQMLRRD